MGWDDPVGAEEAGLEEYHEKHRHWCDACNAYWEHPAEGCPRVKHDGPEVFGMQLWAPADWPCPEHEDKEERCD